ncbi:hypothetical protein [Propionibacterium phage Philemon]|uniref:Minor tail protein n=1 Tax=Propionibacterium phage Philemon TaxID=3141823 RepID=A0AAU6VXX9_9VIRU
MFAWLFQMLAKAWAGLLAKVDGMVPDVPDGVSSGIGGLAGAAHFIAPIWGWLPGGALLIALGILVVCLGASVTIRIVRIIASFLTLGGGA